MLGEAARTQADADRYLAAYRDAIIVVGKSVHAGRDLFARDSVSVKLSALHSRHEVFHADVAVPTLIARIVELEALAPEHGLGLPMDAEASERLKMSLDIIAGVTPNPALPD